MGTKIDSIKDGTVDVELHSELMVQQVAIDQLDKAAKPSDSTDPAKASYDTFKQENVNLPSGTTTGDGSTGQKTTTLDLLKANGLDNSQQPVQPSSDIGRSTNYD